MHMVMTNIQCEKSGSLGAKGTGSEDIEEQGSLQGSTDPLDV